MFNRIRLITIAMLVVAALLVLGGSTVLAQGPNFPTPVPKAPAGTGTQPQVAPKSQPGAPVVVPTIGAKPTSPAVKPQANTRANGTRAVPGPQSGWVSSFRVQNLGTATASCQYIFYATDGTAAYTSASTAVNVGDSLFVYTPSLSSSTFVAGQYSGVVSCDQPVAAVVNYSAPAAGGPGSGGDVFNGVTDQAMTWYAPNIFNNYYNYYTNVVVQDASGSTNNIKLDIYAPGATTPTATQNCTAAKYASCNLDQSGAAALAANVAYSAVISGSGNIAPIVNIYGLGAAASEQYSYNAFKDGGTKVYAPVVMNQYFGYQTAITVMNIGGATTNIIINYGSGQTDSFNGLTANSARVFFTPNSSVPVGTLTSATVNSTASNIIVLVNENNSVHRATSYNGFTAGKTTARAPIVMRRYVGYNTSVTCQNVGTGPTTMTIAYGGISGSSNPTSPSNPIPIGGSALFYQPADSKLADGFIGSATVSASGGGASIVCVVNEDMNEGALASTSMDQLYGYNAIGQ